MKGFAIILFVTCFVSFNIDQGSALKCYQCDDTIGKDSDCEKNVEEAKTEDCADNSVVCYTFFDDTTVTRKCGEKEVCTKIEEASKSKHKYCSSCNTDLCNKDSDDDSDDGKGSGFTPTYSTSMFISLAFFALTKLFM